eukprot:gene3762-6285_t
MNTLVGNNCRLVSFLLRRHFSRYTWSMHLPRWMSIEASHDTIAGSLHPPSTPSISASNLAEIRALASRLGEDLQNEDLLVQALTHRTFDGYAHNGRLCLLGESIIQQSVTEHLYFNFPNLYSSALRDICSRFLSPHVLAPIGNRLGFQHALLYKHVVEENTQAKKPAPHPGSKRAKYHQVPEPPKRIPQTAVASAFKAFIGALHVDQENLSDFIKLEHPRVVLQHIHASSGLPPLDYRVIEETGRASHLPTFMIGVFAGESCLGTGAGFSLKFAKAEAARSALRKHYLSELRDAPSPYEMVDYDPAQEVRITAHVIDCGYSYPPQ